MENERLGFEHSKLGIIALSGCADIALKINSYLVKWCKENERSRCCFFTERRFLLL